MVILRYFTRTFTQNYIDKCHTVSCKTLYCIAFCPNLIFRMRNTPIAYGRFLRKISGVITIKNVLKPRSMMNSKLTAGKTKGTREQWWLLFDWPF